MIYILMDLKEPNGYGVLIHSVKYIKENLKIRKNTAMV